ncbi:hypothetical protein LAZ67_13001688 [Cordylochernes scorpioides]|uniref:Uncharacterized protein n=1 Tax=Cordylochernes scorpioides TaxID=51811 RepID=A0ABY6L804_9ARAC|nr:hypothetical protein LAZ67_13001688 [Cordylochernes scorpioides]
MTIRGASPGHLARYWKHGSDRMASKRTPYSRRFGDSLFECGRSIHFRMYCRKCIIAALSLTIKYRSKNAIKEVNDFGFYNLNDVAVAAVNSHNSKQSRSPMISNVTPDHNARPPSATTPQDVFWNVASITAIVIYQQLTCDAQPSSRIIRVDWDGSEVHIAATREALPFRFHRRVKAKTSPQDDNIPLDDTTTKPLFQPQEKACKGTRDKVPRFRWNPLQKHVRSMHQKSIGWILTTTNSNIEKERTKADITPTAQTEELIKNNCTMMTYQIMGKLYLSKGSILKLINDLGYQKLCSKWPPKLLTKDMMKIKKD